jgi:hypothetical protein
MPGAYALDLDEALTLNSARDTEEVLLRITCSGMAPVYRTFELYRPETTEGQTLTVSSGTGNAAVQSIAASAITASAIASDAITSLKIADGAITAAKIADAAIDSATFAPGAIDASSIAAGGANKIADHTIRRTLANARASSNGDTVNARSLLGAASKLKNAWDITSGTLTVMEEDDTTPFFTEALTGTTGADPITAVDPT